MPGAPLDPRAPVVVGVGQITNRVDEGAEPLEPVALMAEAMHRAERDSGGHGVLARAGAVRTVAQLSWRYPAPSRLLADALGCPDASTGVTTNGGNWPQTVLNTTAAEIQRGELDVAVLCGAEAWRSRRAAKAEGTRPDWTAPAPGIRPDPRLGPELDMTHPAELAVGVILPGHVYPMLDNLRRQVTGRTPAEQRELMARRWSAMSAVAADNPYAWNRRRWTPDDLLDGADGNRMVAHPYRRAFNSYEWVDQAAGVIVCSVEAARGLGVPADRWVFVHAGADTAEPSLSVRRDPASPTGMAACARSVLGHSGVDVDDVARFDLYSCFPSAVDLAASALGVAEEDDRPLSVTGGMAFAGGPWNNFGHHAIAAMAECLREDPGSLGLVTGNGGYLHKQAFGLYSTSPPARAFVHDTTLAQAEVDAAATRPVLDAHEGSGDVELWTVAHDREGRPSQALASVLTPDGGRAWVASDDASTMAWLADDDRTDTAVTVSGPRFAPGSLAGGR